MNKVFSFSTDAHGSLALTPCDEPIDFSHVLDTPEDVTSLDLDAVQATVLEPERAALTFARDMRFGLQLAIHPNDLAGITRTDTDMLIIDVVPDVSDASFAVASRCVEDRRAVADALRDLADQIEDTCEEEQEERLSA